jgi:hypothetical protein
MTDKPKLLTATLLEHINPYVNATDEDGNDIQVVNTGLWLTAGTRVLVEWHEAEGDIPAGYRIKQYVGQ